MAKSKFKSGRCLVRGPVGGCDVEVVFDPAAPTTLIRADLAEAVGRVSDLPLLWRVRLPGGEVRSARSWTQVELRYEDVRVEAAAIVVRDAPFPVIIGSDWLESFNRQRRTFDSEVAQ